MALSFDTRFEPAHGKAVEVAPDVLRVTAPNAGPLTFHGTNSYIVGKDTLAVIDPGPAIDSHYEALRAAIAGRPVSHVAVSHTHRDHSPLARRLAAETGAIVVAEGPHRPARPLNVGEVNPLKEASDLEFQPDRALADGDRVEGDGWTLTAVHTPGHTANHTAYALEEENLLFSADHVMAWATSIVAPPDGAMSDFMTSLGKLMERDDRLYLPGHGGPVRQPQQFLRGLRTHRRMRERAILERLRKGDRTISEMVGNIYRDTDPRLHNAAGLSVLAHLEDLVARGDAVTEGPASIAGTYLPG